MKRHIVLVTGFGILFLIFIQIAGTLVESIYILNLLKSSLNAKALGVVFFFTPLLLLPFGKRAPGWLIWLAFALLAIGRGVAPYLSTSSRMLAAGIGTGGVMVLIPLLLARFRDTGQGEGQLIPAQGLALGVGLSILLRTLNYSVDLSLTAAGGWIGWVLAIMLGLCIARFPSESKPEPSHSVKGSTSAALGIVAVLTLFYFAFASPGVIARWTEGNYQIIVMAVSLLSLLWLFISLSRPNLFFRIKPSLLVIWNVLFTLALTGTILAHTVRFPATLDSPAVVVGAPTWYQQVPLVFMLLLFPVLFIDFGIFSGAITRLHPAPSGLALGFTLGALALVVLIFMDIFTNVWGYVRPISPFFRNKYWLPFLLLSGGITLLILPLRQNLLTAVNKPTNKSGLYWSGAILAAILLGTLVGALLTDRRPALAPVKTSLRVMTYNIQQANDVYGEKAYDRQIALIRQVDPDILALEETDATRISLNNNDIVRYYANKLGYYEYYGPKTVTGTYGAALLSKYPLQNPLTFFSYSDKDEAGSVEADIEVGDQTFTVFCVHPDESDPAMIAFAQTLLARAASKPLVIAMGDYNLRDYDEAYKLLDQVYKNAWISVYPTGIDDNGLDMSGENRIDHIFVSPQLKVSDPAYLLPPESGTDHPAHWATISW